MKSKLQWQIETNPFWGCCSPQVLGPNHQDFYAMVTLQRVQEGLLHPSSHPKRLKPSPDESQPFLRPRCPPAVAPLLEGRRERPPSIAGAALRHGSPRRDYDAADNKQQQPRKKIINKTLKWALKVVLLLFPGKPGGKEGAPGNRGTTEPRIFFLAAVSDGHGRR